jgi:hypothetical protein
MCFLVSSIKEAAKRIVQHIRDNGQREHLGQKAKESVRQRFLLTRLLTQYLDLFNSFEIIFRLADKFKDYEWLGYPGWLRIFSLNIDSEGT